jgi:hypothetical protein
VFAELEATTIVCPDSLESPITVEEPVVIYRNVRFLARDEPTVKKNPFVHK